MEQAPRRRNTQHRARHGVRADQHARDPEGVVASLARGENICRDHPLGWWRRRRRRRGRRRQRWAARGSAAGRVPRAREAAALEGVAKGAVARPVGVAGAGGVERVRVVAPPRQLRHAAVVAAAQGHERQCAALAQALGGMLFRRTAGADRTRAVAPRIERLLTSWWERWMRRGSRGGAARSCAGERQQQEEHPCLLWRKPTEPHVGAWLVGAYRVRPP